MKKMTTIVTSSLALVLLAGLVPAHAQTQAVDPLWSKTRDQAELSKKYVPQDVETVGQRKDDSGDAPVTVRSHLTGWDKDEPRYSLEQVAPKPDPAKAAKKKKPFEVDKFLAMANILMEPGIVPKRIDQQSLDGRIWTVFDVSKKEMGQEVAAKLWVDPATGCLHQMDLRVHMPLSMDVAMLSTYEQHVQGYCAPKKVEADFEMLVPFMHIKAHVVNMPSNWIARPAL